MYLGRAPYQASPDNLLVPISTLFFIMRASKQDIPQSPRYAGLYNRPDIGVTGSKTSSYPLLSVLSDACDVLLHLLGSVLVTERALERQKRILAPKTS